MALVFKDRVKVTSTTTGTGAFTLGSAVTGYQSFSVIGNGNTTQYTIVDDAGNWEVGTGTYTSSGTTLSRDTVLESSNSNSLVNFPAGTKTVFVTYAADKSVTIDNTATLTNKTMSGASNTFSNIPNSALVTTPVTSVSGTSPVASSGGATPAISLSSGYGDTQNPYASKTANYILASPNGSSGVPTFRAMVAADVPTLNQNTTGSAATLTTTRTLWGQNFNGSANVTGALSSVTTMSMSGRLTSTLATGTSPFSVTSTTINTNLNADLLDGQHGSYYAPIASPTLTGTPAAPTAAVGTNTTQLATTAFVNSEIANDAFLKAAGGSIVETVATISANYSITSGSNGLSAGPISINSGVTVTIPTGSTWVVV